MTAPHLDVSSIPEWAHSPVALNEYAIDRSGRSYVLVGVGPDTESAVRRWSHELDGKGVLEVLAPDVEQAGRRLAAVIDAARVGLRVLVTGPTSACLALRGVAVNAGLEDDEVSVCPTGAGSLTVFCAHCRAVTEATAGIGDTAECVGCERQLLIYHHVSRRSGQFLGFMVDAEEAAC